ncbi:MAG: prepilin-type N-terminal cleavage/methylation domain-containing protein [Planctomycetota bacterium]
MKPATRQPRTRTRTRTRTRARNRAGFTLVEALIASTILTLSVVALSETLIATYTAESAIRRQEQATSLAMDLTNQIIAKPISSDEMPDELPPSNAVTMRNDGTGTALPAGDANVVDARLFQRPAILAEMPTIDAVSGLSDTVAAPVSSDHPAAGNYTRTVTVTRHRTPDGPVDDTGSLRKVTVAVTDPTGREHVVSRVILPSASR